MQVDNLKNRIKRNFISTLINLFLLLILLWIFSSINIWTINIQIPTWKLFLYVVGGIIVIRFIIFIFKRFSKLDIIFLNFICFILPFSWFINFILSKWFALISHGKLINSKFHEINEKKHEYMPLIIKLIVEKTDLFEQLPPIAQKYFLYCKEKKFSFDSLQKVYGYYREPPIELAYRLGKGEKLEEYEKERLIYESNLQERLLIENNLPPSNPILQEINKRQQIQLDSGFSIMK